MKIKIPKETNYEKYFKRKNLYKIVLASKESRNYLDKRVQKKPYLPVLKDLYFLYELIVQNKRTTVLEYGCGWSTLIMHKALMDLKKKNNSLPFKRSDFEFGIIAVDNLKKFIRISKKRMKDYNCNEDYFKFFYSPAQITLFNDRYAVEYKKQPLINPDLILIDGPDQWGVKKFKDGFTTAHKTYMPMLCQVLKYEHFLVPGTIMILDGRVANARFIEKNLQRNWVFLDLYKKFDVGVFYLDEEPLGKFNQKQLKFYNFI